MPSLSLISMPFEILFEIFSQTLLTVDDNARLQRVCKTFQPAAQAAKGLSYHFRVDAFRFEPWRFFRYLLQNPEIGQKITQIDVSWERRDVKNILTWTNRWSWDEEERVKIQTLIFFAKKKSFATTIETALKGFNSEALLPLLLLFTPNLEHLDMGDTEPSFLLIDIYKNAPHERCFPLLNRLGRYVMQYTSNNGTWDSNNIDEVLKLHEPDAGSPQLWLHKNIKFTVSGFQNLRHFDHGYGRTEIHENDAGYYGFYLEDLLPIFFLPKIESIRLSTFEVSPDGKFFTKLEKYLDIAQKSPVKYLELVYAHVYLPFLVALANATGNLEYFFWCGHPAFYDYFSDDVNYVPTLIKAFLNNNTETLEKSHFLLVDPSLTTLQLRTVEQLEYEQKLPGYRLL
ncbi:hypothetical protein TWF730_008733 [Orbilia blumenaviensis]|uniref:F-box domain-containing protein n=1 Tax=Orbilia blumenaviensis TaxID=1796055 RepID=A0AAV9V375_9PEZI